jgi:DNA-binding XRE family transcriptional regulator
MIPKRPQHCDQHPRYQKGCDDCRLISQKWERVRARERAYYGPRRVPAEQVTAHVRRLAENGMTPAEVARAAGVSQTTTHYIAHGRREMVHRVVHNRLMSVTLSHQYGFYVPALGLGRRIQHLYWMGWSGRAIAEMGETTQSQVHEIASLRRDTISRDLHDRELWSQDGGSVRAKNTAKRNGWPSIFAWVDPDSDARTFEELGAAA